MHCVHWSQSMIMRNNSSLPDSTEIKLFTYGIISTFIPIGGIQPRISSWPQMDFPGLFLIGMPLIMVRAGYCMFWLEFSLAPNFGHYSTGGILYSAIRHRPCWVECDRNVKMSCSTDLKIQTWTWSRKLTLHERHKDILFKCQYSAVPSCHDERTSSMTRFR